MTKASITPLAYQPDATRLFENIAHLPWSQLLDSCQTDHSRARYDILVADPVYKLISQNGETTVFNRNNQTIESTQDPFVLLHKYSSLYQIKDNELPFYGGAVGYLGYDLLPVDSEDNRPALLDMPDLAFGIYEWSIINDHKLQKTFFVSVDEKIRPDELFANSLINKDTNQPGLSIKHLQNSCNEQQYAEIFQRIQHYLTEGDCYQVNFARCFYSQCEGNAWASYKQLRTSNPVPFGAYLNLPFAKILSCSPERFIKVRGNRVETCPIKGTSPRSDNNKQDLKLQEQLANSSKDKAENLMIVDLLRNDLGKSCLPGSIKVPELFNIEAFPTVFHMVSTVTGTRKEQLTALDVLQNSFPGGSITGAPKKRAMQIIQELETFKRQLYCGSIGYISFNGNIDTNIAIRTLVSDGKQLVFWAGGGIVSDSQPDQEFAETIDKARAFLSMLTDNNDWVSAK